MGLFEQLFGHTHKDMPALLPAIERAVNQVEPLLKHTSGYHNDYYKPVSTALDYAHSLANSVPGPVTLNRESYASDSFVHALFPSVDFVVDAFCTSQSMRDYYHNHPDTDQLYALMGMRRFEKSVMGMQLSGEVIQRDVVQKIVYFTSHTLENPAATEQEAREQVALSFFDNLVGKVKKRVEARKQEMHAQQQEKDMLTSRLRSANIYTRPALEQEFSRLISEMQTTASSQDLSNYMEDFEAILLNPEQHLRIEQKSIVLDSMGIRYENSQSKTGKEILFNELIDFDRRNWTVTMVHCSQLQSESFADRLEQAYRRLAI